MVIYLNTNPTMSHPCLNLPLVLITFGIKTYKVLCDLSVASTRLTGASSPVTLHSSHLAFLLSCLMSACSLFSSWPFYGPTVCCPPHSSLVNSYLHLKCKFKCYFPIEALLDARFDSQLYGLTAHCISAFSTQL